MTLEDVKQCLADNVLDAFMLRKQLAKSEAQNADYKRTIEFLTARPADEKEPEKPLVNSNERGAEGDGPKPPIL